MEVTNRSELLERFEQMIHMLEQVNKWESQYTPSETIKNNGMECTCQEQVVLEVISYMTIPNDSIIISIIPSFL